jgi:hypothetical protein
MVRSRCLLTRLNSRGVGRVGWVAVCNLVSESVCEVVADRVVECFNFA